jgi:hypothetical protein
VGSLLYSIFDKSWAMTTLTSPHDLLAAVPFLIGYHPTNSLVVISLKGETLGMAMRIDFPSEIEPDQIDTLADHLIREKSDGALIVAYLPPEIDNADFLLDPLREAIEIRAIDLRECLVVKNGRWKSTMCDDTECCPPEGTALPDITASRISAEQVAAGKPMPLADSQSLTDSLVSTDTDLLLLAEIKKIPLIKYSSDNVVELEREGALAVNDCAQDFSDMGVIKDRKLLALTYVRLHDVQVRDFAMGITNSENAELLTNMWRFMLRIAPPGYIAPVASLFAAISYESGNGVIAQRALDLALEDNSAYPMAKLLRRVFSAGWPPSQFADMRADLHPRVCALLFPKSA